MLRILIADGTPAAMQPVRETFGIPSNASLFEAALRSHSYPVLVHQCLPVAKTSRTACRSKTLTV